MLTRLAARLYPRWWRERYGEEFEALIEDARPGLRGTMDVTRGALAMQISTPFSAKRIWLLGGLLGLAIGWAASFWMSPAYRSSAVLQFPGSSSDTNQATLAKISETANVTMSRGSLTNLIRQLNLYSEEKHRMPLEKVLETMRRNILLTPTGVPGAPAFRISFDYPDRILAQRTVAELTKGFLSSGGTTLDSPSLPTNPVLPNRLAQASAGLGAGVVAGGIVALLVYIRRLQKKVKQLS
jgi:uncharacterized protein involved in exopolysaccharide biosynthesis